MPRDDPLWTVAVHEAGHGVVGILLGHDVVDAWVDPSTTSGGCRGMPWGTDEERAIGYAAGVMAVWLERLGPPELNGKDRRRATELVGKTQLKQVQVRAGRLLVNHWKVVQRVAKALMDNHKVTGDEVRELVGSAVKSLEAGAVA